MLTVDIKPDSRGKVRDMYDLGDQLLVVASDRISAFDFVLPNEIPEKGRVLNQLSVFWFELLEDVVNNHLISADVADLPDPFKPYADYLEGRFMLVRKAQMFPVECIVRGYLTGSGLVEYEERGTVCDIALPPGLVNSSKLPEVLFTPSTKADLGDHDENISFDVCCELVGEEAAARLRELSLTIYRKAAAHAAAHGIIIADTKFEFGVVDGEIILADEVLTPDSSRFWSAELYEVGQEQPSFDKQFVRNWLSANWDRMGEPPALPADIIQKTSEKYLKAYELITDHAYPYAPSARA